MSKSLPFNILSILRAPDMILFQKYRNQLWKDPLLIEVDHKTEILFSNINWVLTGWYHNAQIIFFDHLTGFRDSTRLFQISVNLSEII